MTLHHSSTPIQQHAVEIVQRLQEKGFKAYWVGGSVRDLLRGVVPKDIDVATNATPDEIADLFPWALDIGKAFGVMSVSIQGHHFETATFRHDIDYRDGRHPSRVTFSSPEEDAKRRDFTINAIFYDPLRETVYDYVKGQQDLQDGIIRAIGSPEDRFKEDHLRMLRAVRFASTLTFSIEEHTRKAIQRCAPLIHTVSAERIQQELTRLLLESPRAGDGLQLLRETGLLTLILPEVAAMIGQEQPPQYHPEGDVFTHTKIMLNAMERPTARLAYAVLLHDVAKPVTASYGPDAKGNERIRFDGHDRIGADMAESILKRLKCSSQFIAGATYCVRNHMRFMEVQRMKKSTLRRLIGAPTFDTELELHRLDCLSSHGKLDNYQFLLDFAEQLKDEPVLPPRWISGHDVMALGIPEGPEVGFWVKTAYDAQIEGRFTDRAGLLTWIKKSVHEQKKVKVRKRSPLTVPLGL